MTTLPKDYEFLRPGDPDKSAGTPGLDPFPQLDAADELRLVAGERLRERWEGTSLHWSASRRPRQSNLGPDGEFVRRGRLTVVLTNLRLAVIVPQEHLSYESFPGRGATVAPSGGDKFKLRMLRRLGTKVAPKLVDDLLGDLSPRTGHVPLDCIASLDGEQALVVRLQLAGAGHAELRIGMRDAAPAVRAITEQIRARWTSLELPEPFGAAAASIAVDTRFTAPLLRAMGGHSITTADGGASAPAPAALVPPRPAAPGGWTCAKCGHANPADQKRCLRCRQARHSTSNAAST